MMKVKCEVRRQIVLICYVVRRVKQQAEVKDD